MSKPRLVLSGVTYFITRCTLMQYFLLQPDEKVVNLILYTLAVIAAELAIQVHALCIMADHLHLVITDTRGNHPIFTQRFHRNVALGIQALRKWDNPVFEKKPPSVVALGTPEAIIEKIAYTIANPVTAGLVNHAHEWPGVKILVDDIGRTVLRIKRPDFYFNPKNKQWPEYVDLPISLPPTVTEQQADGFREAIKAEVTHREASVQDRMKHEGRRFMGAQRAMMIPPTARAKTQKPRNQLNPTIAAGRGKTEARKAAIKAERAFRMQYRIALDRWRGDDRDDAIFPDGTWWMRVFHKARTVSDISKSNRSVMAACGPPPLLQ